MEFPDFSFDTMNEADVREEIIAPLLRHLGYRSGTEHDVIREQHLSYSRLQLGRQKASDPLLQGKADYICVAGRRVRWVIEAKSPSQALDIEAERQAWTYAAHPEIRAVYFAITNGREFKLYATTARPDSPPLMKCIYGELPRALLKIENTLSPASILRDHPEPMIDEGRPLGPGLRSLARITGGLIKYSSITPSHSAVPVHQMRPLLEMVTSITDGYVQRADSEQITVSFWTLVPFQSLQLLNQQLGLDRMSMTSPNDTISVSSDAPSVFISQRRVVIPEGTQSLDLLNWKMATIPMNLTLDVQTKAAGHLEGNAFRGSFAAQMKNPLLSLVLDGRFEVYLA